MTQQTIPATVGTVIAHCTCGAALTAWRFHPTSGNWILADFDNEITALFVWAASIQDAMAWGATIMDSPATAHQVQDCTGWVLNPGTCEA